MVWRLPRLGEKQRSVWAMIFVIGAIGLWFPLSRLHWAYYITASSLYGLMWGTLPFGMAVLGNILLTGLIIWSQALNLSKPISLSVDLLFISVFVVGWSVLLAWWMRSVMKESAERKRLIEQLEAAQRNLAAAERQAGMLQERQRLAQEIHDALAQGFTSIVMQLEAADQALPEDQPAVRGRIQQARETARASLAEARRLVLALKPAPLEGASLIDALERVVGGWSQESGIQASFSVTGTTCSLPAEIEVTLLRATQEALVNIQKHARASQANVTLSYMEEQIALDIHDDGVGFDPDRLPNLARGGYGLRAMRERVEQIGGVLIVESASGQGATLAIQIPVISSQLEAAS
jgi:signal transduction histidine kinase